MQPVNSRPKPKPMRILLLPITLLLASCSNFADFLPTFTPHKIEIRQGNLVTQDMRARIKTGMSEAQVKAILGAPLIADIYHAGRWDYLYRLEKQGQVEVDQRLTLYFENGVLVRIDDATPLLPSPVPIQEIRNED
jgi:outer membrane protein assembly factor BamE